MQYYKGEQVVYTSHGYVSLNSTYIPNLPNAGFEPQNGFSVAFALVLMISIGIAAYPYVRKAFTFIRG